MATKFENVMNEDVRAEKDVLENLNTRKSKSRMILTGISSKNSELKPNLNSKRFERVQEFSIDTIQDKNVKNPR